MMREPGRQGPTEQGRSEGPFGRTTSAWRRKGGLETPIVGRMSRERYLIFAPPRWYDNLVTIVIVGGLGSAILSFLGLLPPVGLLDSEYWKVFGTLFGLAGLWAYTCNERMTIDLKNRTYARLEGSGFLKRISRGSLDDLYALILMSEIHPLGGQVIYRLVFFWKNSKLPLMVVDDQRTRYAPGMLVNHGAGQLNQRGMQYARWLNIPYQDASGVHSPAPVPVI